MTSLPPRAVFVTRETDFDLLLAKHATREQTRFFLDRRGQSLVEVEARHRAFEAVLTGARAAIPESWRQVHVLRGNLDRFLFTPEDIVIAVGQDGLVANLAKYLSGQPVLGINPAPELYDGVLTRHTPDALPRLLKGVAVGRAEAEARTMVEAELENGERLRALNEIFIGHRSHQSARYYIETGKTAEEQSSSGLIVATGTGATGWARSIMEASKIRMQLNPVNREAGYFVREPFPSVRTGTDVRAGVLAGQKTLTITSHMNEGGVIFADGIEQDFIAFEWGRVAKLHVANEALNLVVG